MWYLYIVDICVDMDEDMWIMNTDPLVTSSWDWKKSAPSARRRFAPGASDVLGWKTSAEPQFFQWSKDD